MGVGMVTYKETSDELFQAVKNDNTDRIAATLNSVGKEEAKSLANEKDKINNEPIAYLAIRKGSLVAYKSLADAGANLEVYFGPNQGQHVAAIYGRDEIMKDIRSRGIKPKTNFRNATLLSLAERSKNSKLIKFLEEERQAAPTSAQPSFLKGGNRHAEHQNNVLLRRMEKTRRKV
jgi:hypothetical protein